MAIHDLDPTPTRMRLAPVGPASAPFFSSHQAGNLSRDGERLNRIHPTHATNDFFPWK